jgi:hypothetical protein
VYVYLLKCFAKPLIYLSILMVLVVLVAAGYYSYNLKDEYSEDDDSYKYALYGSYVAWALAGIYLLVVCCCRKRIQLAGSIVQASSDFFAQTTRIIFVPVFSYVFLFVWVFLWTILAVWLWSVGEVSKDETLPIANIEWDSTTRAMWWYIVFGLFWLCAFIRGGSDFIIALTATQWYFQGCGSSSSDNKGQASVFLSASWTLRYHLGSVAFGSLLIAIMNMVKLVFEYIKKKFDKYMNN